MLSTLRYTGQSGVTTLLARPFRPLFACASIFAVLVMGGWLAIFHGILPAPRGFAPGVWHAHEMVFGYAVAVIAGFLLTAVENWTGRETARGKMLAVLVGLWLTARITPFVPVPDWLGRSSDLAFLIVVALIVGKCVYAAGQRRNLVMVVILALLAVTHGFFYAGLGRGADPGMEWVNLALRLIVVLIALIAGRVVPSFTGNAIAGHQPAAQRKLETASIVLLGVWLVAESIPGTAGWLRLVAGIGIAVVLGLRCRGWFAPGVVKNPMLWVLYAGFIWVVTGFGLTALAAVYVLPGSAATHAFTVGGIGVMTAGMMARVTMGHTGRPIRASRTLVVCFGLLNAAALVRVAVPIFAPHWFVVAVSVSSWGWMLGFALLAWNLLPMVVAPRVDGKNG